MLIKRRGFLTGLVSFLAAPALVKAANIMPISPQPYATIWGVDRFGNVVKHSIYEPMSVAGFGNSPHIDKFMEVTGWEYDFPVAPLPMPSPYLLHWREPVAIEPMAFIKPLKEIPTEGVSDVFQLGDYVNLKHKDERIIHHLNEGEDL